MANPVPHTEAGRALVGDEPRLVTGEHSMLVRVLAIEAEAISLGHKEGYMSRAADDEMRAEVAAHLRSEKEPQP